MLFSQYSSAQIFNYEWAKFGGGSGTDLGTSIAVDNQGNVYTAGRFQNTVDFNPSPTGTFNLTSAGDFDMFLQKLNANGEFQWAIRIGGTGFDQFEKVAIAPNGDIWAISTFSATVDFDPGAGSNEKTSAGSQDGAIIRFDSNANLISVYTIGGIEAELIRGLDIDNNGRVLIPGNYRAQCTFNHAGGSFSLTASGAQDAFMMSLTANGNLEWINTINGTFLELVKSAAFDNAGNAIIAGRFTGTPVFAPGLADLPMASNGAADVYLLKLNVQGNLQWLKTYGGASSEDIYAITTDNQNNILVSGYFYTDTDLDPGAGVVTIPVSGSDDCFIQKFNPSGNLIWVKAFGGPNLENAYDIACDSENSVYLVGDFFETVDFNPGAEVFNLTSLGNNDIFTL